VRNGKESERGHETRLQDDAVLAEPAGDASRLPAGLGRDGRRGAESGIAKLVGDPDRELRDKLRAKVRKHRLIGLAPLLLAGSTMLTASGCGVRTVYVPHGMPVRLRETVKDVKVWVKDTDGKPVPGRMDLPQGWYCLPVHNE